MAGCETNLLTLIESISGVLLDQVLVGEKTNEIPHAVPMLEAADLDAETLVTADAMHTQPNTAELILKKTLTTSSPSKGTRGISKKPSSKRHLRRVGHYQRVVRSLVMDE
jgi:predicted transposase YbfD/YdcC